MEKICGYCGKPVNESATTPFGEGTFFLCNDCKKIFKDKFSSYYEEKVRSSGLSSAPKLTKLSIDEVCAILSGDDPETVSNRRGEQTKGTQKGTAKTQGTPTEEQKKAQKVAGKAKKACCVCGKKDCAGGRLIQDNYRLCEICASNYIATVPGATESDEFFLSHGPDFFKDALAECCNPYRNISFNFKTKKIYLKNALLKKNYKVVNFSDLIGFHVDVKAVVGNGSDRYRTLDADFRYNGTTVRYHIDDSLSETKDQVFDEIVDCFTQVQNSSTRLSSQQSAFISSAAQIQNSSIHHAQVQQSSACGSTQSSASPYQFRCPYCGGTNCTPVVETSTTGKDFSTGKACCGSLFFWNPAGLLCGFCGKGKQTTSTTYWMCHTCGSKFQK